MRSPGNNRSQQAAMAVTATGLLALAAATLLPDSLLRSGNWSAEDAKLKSELSSRLHRSGYATPASMGLTPEEHREQMQKMSAAHAEMSRRLQAAIEEPVLWRSRLKLWGAACVGVGAALYLIGRPAMA